MIDFSANKYVHNIHIKHLRGIFMYEKQQIKGFLSKTSLINKLN